MSGTVTATGGSATGGSATGGSVGPNGVTPGTSTPGTATAGTVIGGNGTPGSATPGTATAGTATAGTATGGTATGGSATGGSGTGGSAIGSSVGPTAITPGTATGGAGTSGTATGGSATGGSATGGSVGPNGVTPGTSTPGTATAGTVTGGSGTATAGTATAGTATAGTATGGTATGGSATGGSGTGGSATGGSVGPTGVTPGTSTNGTSTNGTSTNGSTSITPGNLQTPGGPQFIQTNLISDGSVTAAVTDPNLINPWGISFSSTTPFWISDQGTNFTSVDSVTTSPAGATGQSTINLNVIPPVSTPSPTGQVFNNFASSKAFTLPNGQPATFIFASTTGQITGWNQALGTQAAVAVTNSNAVYTGLAIGSSASGPTLYAANFKNQTIDMYDSNFKLIKSISNPEIPSGFTPYGVQVLNNQLFVSLAPLNRGVGPAQGVVDQYDLNGNHVGLVAAGGSLNAPWGLTVAPSSFGAFANALLVGNFGDGTINAFDFTTHKFLGQISGSDGKPLVNQDLWAITPGSGGAAGDPAQLYFTAGLADEKHGVFGSIKPVGQ